MEIPQFKIYTSYLANLKNIPPEIVKIAICGSRPGNYNGLVYKPLMPKYEFFMQYKDGIINKDGYTKAFYEQVLSKITPEEVVKDFYIACRGRDVVMWCYEKPGDFCHRHLVSRWMEKYDVKEWGKIIWS